MAWQLLIGGAVGGLDYLSKQDTFSRQRNQAKKQFKLNERQRRAAHAAETAAIQKRNAYRLKIYDRKLEDYKINLEWSKDAAMTAFRDASMDMNRTISQTFMASQDLLRNTVQRGGRAAATGNAMSKNAYLADLQESEGLEGQNRAVLLENLLGSFDAYEIATDEIAKQWYRHDYNLWQGVRDAPMLEEQTAFQPGEFVEPQAPNAWMSAFNSGMKGIGAMAPFLPASTAKNFGSATFGQKLNILGRGLGGLNPFASTS